MKKSLKQKKVLNVECNPITNDKIVVEQLSNLTAEELAIYAQPHTHSFYEIFWYQQEGGTYTVDFQDFNIRQNSLFFLTPGQVHSFQGIENARGYLIKICPDFTKFITPETDDINSQLLFSFSEHAYAILQESGIEVVEKVIRRIDQELKVYADAESHDKMLRLLVRILIIEIRRHSKQDQPEMIESKRRANALFLRFRAMVESEFLQMHQVSDYADKLGVSIKTLGNAVRLSTGHTPLTLINERLVLEAKRKLRYSDLLVKEVAYELGFDDPSNFVKFFRHYTGYLPSEFQKNNLR